MSIKVRFLGNAAFEVTNSADINILIDPWITGNPHCPVKLEDFKKVSIVLVSHLANDHGRDDAVRIVNKTGATLFCGYDMRSYAEKYSVNPEKIKPLVWGQVREHLGIKIKAIEARHGSFLRVGDGYLSWLAQGYMIWIDPDIRLYFMGDTTIFGDLQLIGQLYQPNVVFVPIGACPGFPSEINVNEAALASLWLHPEVAIAMHFAPDSQEPKLWKTCLKTLAPQVKPIILKPGEILRYDRKIICKKLGSKVDMGS